MKIAGGKYFFGYYFYKVMLSVVEALIVKEPTLQLRSG
jgi:hypothetical protein